jgi:hypothetical protein
MTIGNQSYRIINSLKINLFILRGVN